MDKVPLVSMSKPAPQVAISNLNIRVTQNVDGLDTGDQVFDGLLRQLAGLHRIKLQELSKASQVSGQPHAATGLGGPLELPGATAWSSSHPHAVPEKLRDLGQSWDHVTVLEVETPRADGQSEHSARPEQSEPSAWPEQSEPSAWPEQSAHEEGSSSAQRQMMSKGRQYSRSSSLCFKLRSDWALDTNSKGVAKIRKSRNPTNGFSPENKRLNLTGLISDEDQEINGSYEGCLRHLIAYPGSRKRLAWDLSGAILIFWDLLTIPLNISGLAPKDSKFLEMMDWITLVFWSLNMPASLMVGFVREGVTEMHPTLIAMNYFKTWCVLDLIVVGPDWVFTIIQLTGSTGDSSAGDSVKLLRIIRLMRCVRLLRLAKLKWILQSLNDLINSEYTSIVANIFKMILALCAVNHFIGCMWYLIADLNTDGDNWLVAHKFDQSEWTYQYVTSFHWAITQFTPSSMHVQPQNLAERTFAVTVVVFGLVGFSYLVGSITGSLTELRKMNSDASKQFWNLRRYLKQNQVPPPLSVRIQKYLEHQWHLRTSSVSHESVLILNYLSEQLHNELKCAIAVPNMLIHPLFEYLNETSLVTMQRLATTAISRKLLATGDSLFFPLEMATHMSFVVSGKLRYDQMEDGETKTEVVDQREDWIAEPVLWTDSWRHQGQLTALRASDLLAIQATAFIGIIKRNPQADLFVSSYAVRFIGWFNHQLSGKISDIIQGELCTEQIRLLMRTETMYESSGFWMVPPEKISAS